MREQAGGDADAGASLARDEESGQAGAGGERDHGGEGSEGQEDERHRQAEGRGDRAPGGRGAGRCAGGR
ncbi:hypothetical protein [Streptomyces xanthophaeus]